MRGDLMVIVDNSMYSINRDYAKERLDCQIEAIKNITEQKLAESVESTVGIMTIGRNATIKIVSPTNDRNTIYAYLHSIQRDSCVKGGNSIDIARMALKYRINQYQNILLFLGSPLDDTNLMMIVESIAETLNNNIAVSVVLFGEALEYYTLLKNTVGESSDFTCVKIEPKDSFIDGVSTALRETIQEIDPELEMAIKRSLQDVEDPEVQKAITESLKSE